MKLVTHPSSGSSRNAGRFLFPAVILGAVLATVALQVYLHGKGFYSVSFDESGRTLDAFRWVHDREHVSVGWLPGHRVVVGTALRFWPDLFSTPRAMSAVAGVLVLLAATRLAHELFRDRAVTAVTAWVAVLHPPTLILSVVPLTEIHFVFLILLAMIFLRRWLRNGHPREAVLSALAFAAATTFRYEGWLFAGCFLLTVAWRTRDRFSRRAGALLLTLSVITLAFPVASMLKSAPLGFGPLAIFRKTGASYIEIQGIDVGLLLRNSVLGQFIRQNGATLNLIGLLPLALLARRDRDLARWCAVPGLALLILSATSLTGKGVANHTFWRVVAVWGTLLLPFTAHWIVHGSTELLPWKRAARLIAFGAILTAFGMQASFLSGSSAFTRADLETGRFLAERMVTEEDSGGRGDPGRAVGTRVLIDSGTWQYLNVVIASGWPPAFLHNTGENPTQPEDPLIGEGVGLDLDRLVSRGIRFVVVYAPELLRICSDTSGLRRVADFSPWTIFEIDEGGAR